MLGQDKRSDVMENMMVMFREWLAQNTADQMKPDPARLWMALKKDASFGALFGMIL